MKHTPKLTRQINHSVCVTVQSNRLVQVSNLLWRILCRQERQGTSKPQHSVNRHFRSRTGIRQQELIAVIKKLPNTIIRMSIRWTVSTFSDRSRSAPSLRTTQSTTSANVFAQVSSTIWSTTQQPKAAKVKSISQKVFTNVITLCMSLKTSLLNMNPRTTTPT